MARELLKRLPEEAGKPRVQRLVPSLKPVHLEAEVPARERWTVEVDGLVEEPLSLSIEAVASLPVAERAIDFHCVWGWSLPACRWRGVPGEALLECCRPLPEATCALVSAAGGPYASCVRVGELADGVLALELDGRPLTPEHGGPVRFVPPARLWAYKGVKWVERLTFLAELDPGFWESKVGDAEGRVPESILELFERRDER